MVVRETREMLFTIMLDQEQVLHRCEVPLCGRTDRQRQARSCQQATNPSLVRDLCPKYGWSRSGHTVPARHVIPPGFVKRENCGLQRCDCCKPLTGWSF